MYRQKLLCDMIKFFLGACGLMDKAFASEAKDSGFESQLAHASALNLLQSAPYEITITTITS